jgi:L-arabinokinase
VTADIEAFERRLDQLEAELGREGQALFTGAEPPLVARAPGRLDVMGGIGDYSGSLTLELPLAEAAFVSVQRTAAPHVRVASAGFGQDPPALREVVLPLDELRGSLSSYAQARAYLSADRGRAWVAYVAGALAALHVEDGVDVGGGLDVVVCSSVPEGKGVSSSAAVEVASYTALSALAGLARDPVRTALACQRIENLVVGAPCGVMDQMTSSCGREGQLLPILCQPAQLQSGFVIPPGLALWGVDSNIRHQVSGADYTEVRVAAFMGYTLIARALGMPVHPASAGRVQIEDREFGGYLANVGVERFERELAGRLPERLSGAEFLREHAGIVDPITRVVPGATYRVRAATAHPIHEHARATEYRELMSNARVDASACQRLGALMFEAHDSYGACGLGSTGTDRLVALVRELGPARGLFGAKITGGGSGGTVAVLGASDAQPAVHEVARRYARETGHPVRVFSGSSPGAAAFGSARLRRGADGWRVVRAT